MDLEFFLFSSSRYVYIPLDIFLDIYHKNNHNITEELYAEIAAFQQKPEELVNMYSKALEIMDLNTVRYMIEEQKKELEEMAHALSEAQSALAQKDSALAQKDSALAQMEVQMEALRQEVELLNKTTR